MFTATGKGARCEVPTPSGDACSKVVTWSKRGATTTLWKHLRTKQQAVYVELKRFKSPDVGTILAKMRQQKACRASQRELSILTDLLVRWLVRNGRPIVCLEDEEFRQVLQYVSSGRFSCPSLGTVRDRVPVLADRAKVAVAQTIRVVLSRDIKMHIALGPGSCMAHGHFATTCRHLWSCNHLAVLAVLAYWVDTSVPEWELSEMVIGLVPASDHSHTAAWISSALVDVFEDLHIEANNVLTMHTDHAANVVAAVRPFPVHLGCAAHSIHLTAMKLLKYTGSSRAVTSRLGVIR